MSTSSEFILASLGKSAISISILLCGLLLRGWALIKVWGWFIVPLGVPVITFWHALGIALLVSYLTTDLGTALIVAGQDKREWGERMIAGATINIGVPLFLVFMGWVFHSFM